MHFQYIKTHLGQEMDLKYLGLFTRIPILSPIGTNKNKIR